MTDHYPVGPLPVGEDDLQAYVDGRLEPQRAALVKSYLAENPDVATRVGQYAAQRDALAAALQAKYDEPIPARLRVANNAAAQRRGRMALLGRVAAMALLLITGGLSGWVAKDVVGSTASPMHAMTAEAVAAYRTFTVEKARPVEIRANDKAQLVQWLSHRLDVPLTVPDLSREGFRLMGGRLLSTTSGPAAQIMYDDDRDTRLTVFLQAKDMVGTDFRYTEREGVSTFFRAEQGLALAVSASTDRTRLLNVAQSVFQQMVEGRNSRPS